MAITINGAGTITGISAGGLPDGVIVNDDIANTTITDAKLHTSLDFSGHTVTGLPAGGKILKVESTPVSVSTGLYSSYTTYTDSGVTATFTPTAATSKVLINLSLFTHCDASSSMVHVDMYYRLMCSVGGGAYTELEEFRALIRAYTSSGTAQWGGHTFLPYLHTHNTAPATITYKIQFKNTAGGYHTWGTGKTHVWNFLEVAA